MVASPGGSNRRVSGSLRIPSEASTDGGASAIHSPMAVNDCAPASTAAIAAASTEGSEWRASALTWVRHPRQMLQQAQLTDRQQVTVTRRNLSDLPQGRTDQR